MMTLQQKRGLILGGVGVLLLVLILLALLLFRKPEPAPVQEGVTPVEETLPNQDVRDTTSERAPSAPVTEDQASAQVVARNFTERYGTYSTDAPFANVSEVRGTTTPAFQATLEATVRPLEASDYQGVTTRVLSYELLSGSEAEGRLVYRVETQQETSGAVRADSQVVYQPAQITVERVGSVWLVSDFTWL